MKLHFDDSVGAQARQWFADALASSTIDFNAAITTTVTVIVVAEPSVPGHNDYACTSAIPGGWLIEIRRGLDDPSSPLVANIPGPAHLFFMETIAHELAHVLIGQNAADPAVLCPLFVRVGETGTIRVGTVADWNISTRPSVVRSKWEDRIEEAVAEVVKDAALPDRRVYDNRTNWRIAERDFPTLMGALLPPGDFFEDFTVDHTDNWQHLGPRQPGDGGERGPPYSRLLVQAGAAYSVPNTLPNFSGGWHVCTVIYQSVWVGDQGTTEPVGYLNERGPPHPILVDCSIGVEGLPGPPPANVSVTFKIIRVRDNLDLTPELVRTGDPDDHGQYGPFWMDLVDGDVLRWEITAGANIDEQRGVFLGVSMNVPTTDVLQFAYGIPVFVAGGNWRMGYKITLSPDPSHGDSLVYQNGPICELAMHNDVGARIAKMSVGADGLLISSHYGDDPPIVADYHGIELAAGGTWWFTLEVSGDHTVRAAIWSSSPFGGGTPDFSLEKSAPLGTSSLAIFGGGGVNRYPGADPPLSDTHYDDWFVQGVRVQTPDWPYVPAFVVGAAGAPAFLRVG